MRNLSPKTPKRDILSPLPGKNGSARGSGSQNLDLSGIALDTHGQKNFAGETAKDNHKSNDETFNGPPQPNN